MNNQQTQPDYDALMHEACDYLDAGQPNDALKMGKRLEKLCYSGGFEIQALALNDLGKRKKAIKVLERGVKKVPEVWLLWQLLGNYYSDEGKYKKALKVFEQGLHTEGADVVSLKYNAAVAIDRGGDFAKAYEKLEEALADSRFPKDVESPLRLSIQGFRMSLLNKLARYDEVLEVYAEVEPSLEEYSENYFEIAAIYSEVAVAYWKLQKPDEADLMLKKSISWDKSCENAMWLYRERRIDEDNSCANFYWMLVKGRWRQPLEEGGETPGFYTWYRLTANDEQEALDMVKYFEPPEVVNSLEIEEVEILNPAKGPKGIYEMSPYQFFTDEE